MHGRMPANTNDAVFLILNYRKINTKTVPPLSLIMPLMPVTRRDYICNESLWTNTLANPDIMSVSYLYRS